jgi:hypothetical protein
LREEKHALISLRRRRKKAVQKRTGMLRFYKPFFKPLYMKTKHAVPNMEEERKKERRRGWKTH